MSKVAIIVKGGLVQAVYSTDENIDVEVYDIWMQMRLIILKICGMK